MQLNKSVVVRVDHGKEGVLELDQHGDLECGKTPPVMKLTLFSNPIPRQRENKCYKIKKERHRKQRRRGESK